MKEKSNIFIKHKCKYNIVFCPKYKKNVLVGEVKNYLISLIKDKSCEIDATIHELTVNDNNVNMIISCDPQYGIHRVVKSIKNHTSKNLRDVFPHLKSSMPSMWTNNYYCNSIGSVEPNSIQDYIDAQEVRISKNKK